MTDKNQSIGLEIVEDLDHLCTKDTKYSQTYFFKTGKGDYSETDIFIGVTVPNQHKTALKYYKKATFEDLKLLLESQIHEHRLTALLILRLQYEKLAKNDEFKTKIIDFYLENLARVNNWDLVDSSASYILGAYLYHKKLDAKKPDILYELANSGDLWKQRISIIATHYFIKKGDFTDTLAISEILFSHKHDLIHKAVGWMLREIGKIDRLVLHKFLEKYYSKIPRTTLRYAIEKYDEPSRKAILKGIFY